MAFKENEGMTNAPNNLNGLIQVHRDRESRSYTTGYENRSSSDLKCGIGHRGYSEKGKTEDDCTRNPKDWNNKSIK